MDNLLQYLLLQPAVLHKGSGRRGRLVCDDSERTTGKLYIQIPETNTASIRQQSTRQVGVSVPVVVPLS